MFTEQIPLSNAEFITAIFGEDAPWCHVTDFNHPPEAIPKDQHLIAWKGDYYSRYNLTPGHNQYFTISTFYADDTGTARRRKALYRQTHCIVLDDVKEKLSLEAAQMLPVPSWILETSAGSEQWGYILTEPCTDRSMVENLLDGLVANGLAPDGTDPGMKGVTRYVRLPEGSNNKQKKLVNGQPFDCRITEWMPFNRVTMQQLAEPFAVDLTRSRRADRVDGAADVSDHPLINNDIITIKEVRSDGRFDVVCPWVDGHTGSDDSGAAIFTNADGSIGFKCHHGSCDGRTGRDLLRHIENQQPGFTATYTNWQLLREFSAVVDSNASPDFTTAAPAQPQQPVSFMAPTTGISERAVHLDSRDVSGLLPVDFFGGQSVPTDTQINTGSTEQLSGPDFSSVNSTPQVETLNDTPDALQMMCDQLRRVNPSSKEAREAAGSILKAVDSLPTLDRNHWHEEVRDLMQWNKSDFKEIVKDLRQTWYDGAAAEAEFYTNTLFIKELNQFYNWRTQIFYSTDGFQNAHSHEDAEARKNALQEGLVQKVDKLDYAPKMPRVFTEKGVLYGNTYYDGDAINGVAGDVQRWLGHWGMLGWGESQKHMLQWMAFTIRHPDQKINHMMLLGSGEGCGKDFLLYPLLKAMGHNSQVISGEDLLSDFNEYLLSTKYVHINEAELGDRREAVTISNKLKPLATAPPETLRVNPKGTKALSVRNIINATMTTNSQTPLRLGGISRRFYALWSNLKVRDKNGNMTKEWYAYWQDRWDWMKGEGADMCIWYLRNAVDLSDFNPAEAPMMTDFLRQITESSKSPMQQTLEAFIEHRIGCFASDLVTPADMNMTFKNMMGAGEQHMHCDSKYFTPVAIGRTLGEVEDAEQMQGKKLTVNSRLWVVRNVDKYRDMTMNERYQQYEIQIKAARDGVPLEIVR